VRRPLVIAHRGLTTAARENTVASLRAAADLGVDGVEFDVRRAGDGTLVVHHDAEVSGLTIADATLPQVRNAGRAAGYEIPTLAEVLDTVAHRVRLDVELKEVGHERAALELIRGMCGDDDFAITSFHPSTIATLRALDPRVHLGLLVGTPNPAHGLATHLGELVDARRRARRIGADFLAPNWRFVSSGALRRVHLGGMAAWVWTVNEPHLMRSLVQDHRVEAIITDAPALALSIRRTRG
jgi:glycerophosphoryl diester phosphodiesterase